MGAGVSKSDRPGLESRLPHLLAVCVTLGGPFHISEPQLSHQENGNRHSSVGCWEDWIRQILEYLGQVPSVIEMDCLSCKMPW